MTKTKKGLRKIFVILIINKILAKILLINRRSRKVMEGFGLVSKRGRKIYKEGLFPSEWFEAPLFLVLHFSKITALGNRIPNANNPSDPTPSRLNMPANRSSTPTLLAQVPI